MNKALMKCLVGCLMSATILIPAMARNAGAQPVGTVKVAIASNPTLYIRNLILEPLVVSKRGRIGPMLAESWQWKHKRTLEVRLRTDVRFHDGSRFNAAVVKDNFDYFKGAVFPIKAREDFKGTNCEVLSAHTVRFTLSKADALFLHKLSRVYLIAPTRLKKLANNGDYTWGTFAEPGDWGTGPYRLAGGFVGTASWSSELRLAAFESYWVPYYPKVKELQIVDIARYFGWPIKKSFAMGLSAIMDSEGEIDIMPASHLQTLTIAKGQHSSIEKVGRSTMVGLINMRKADSVWRDVRLRQAANMAINRDFMNVMMKGNVEIFPGLIPPGYLGHNPELQSYPYDPDRAKALVRAAGYHQGLKIKIILPFKTQKIIPILEEMLATVGFAPEFIPMGIDELVKHFQLINLDGPVSQQDWDICIIKHTGSTDHPYLDIYRRYFYRDGLLRWIGEDEELFEMVRQFEDIWDENQQDLLLRSCEALQHRKAYMLNLYSLPNTFALNKNIRLSSIDTNDQFFLKEIELTPDHWSLRP